MLIIAELVWLMVSAVQMQSLTTQSVGMAYSVNWISRRVLMEHVVAADCTSRIFQFEKIVVCRKSIVVMGQ